MLNETERLAYEIAEDLGLSVPSYKKRVAIKDIFQMTSAASISSMIATGLIVRSPEEETEPAYYSEDLIELYKVKSADMEVFVQKNDTSFFSAAWILLIILVSYFYGLNKFDHENISKAYDVLEEYVRRDIKQIAKYDSESAGIDHLRRKLKKRKQLKEQLSKILEQDNSSQNDKINKHVKKIEKQLKRLEQEIVSGSQDDDKNFDKIKFPS